MVFRGCKAAIVLVVGIVTLLLCLGFVTEHFPHLAARVLPLPVFGLLLVTIFCNHFVFSEALYLRAHEREPFLVQSIAVAILTGGSTLYMGKFYGASGVALGYFCTSGIFGLVVGTYIFITKRKQWHSASALEKSNTL